MQFKDRVPEDQKLDFDDDSGAEEEEPEQAAGGEAWGSGGGDAWGSSNVDTSAAVAEPAWGTDDNVASGGAW